MCYLQETTYTCSHTQKTLFISCTFAERLTPTIDRRAPSFCLNGLKIVQQITVDGACGVGRNFESCDRLKAQILKPFFDRQAVVEIEFADYAERLRNVRTCLQDGKRPIYNFQQITNEGWDAKAQQERQDAIWTKCLPDSVNSFTAVFAKACNETTTTVYAFTLNILLQKHFGRSMDSGTLPTLTTQIEPDWDPEQHTAVDSKDTPLTDPDVMIFEQVLHNMRTIVQESY